MKFKIDDREYEFDGDYTVAEAMLYFDKANVGVSEIQGALGRGNPYVVATLMYILKKRAGEAVLWKDMQAFPVSALKFIPDEDVDVPIAEAEETDPTQRGGAIPEGDTTNI